jgi:hypothetical protein
MSLYLYKLVPPRPTFRHDMTPAEAAVMERHFAYWQRRVDAGEALVYGPVADPAGAWGLAVICAGSTDEARAFVEDDPAIADGLGTSDLFDLPDAVAAPSLRAA